MTCCQLIYRTKTAVQKTVMWGGSTERNLWGNVFKGISFVSEYGERVELWADQKGKLLEAGCTEAEDM